MDADLDTLEEALGYLIRAMSRPRQWQDIQKLANVSIDRPAAHLLSVLNYQDEGCKLQELALKLGVEAPSVSRTVQRLENENLIIRIVDTNDRRASHLRLTTKGSKILGLIRKAKRERFKVLLSSWSVKDRKLLVQLLHRLSLQASTAADTSILTQTLKETHV